ncbi:MAG: serine hydrolase domain-containing protein [Bacteroidota bacterium]
MQKIFLVIAIILCFQYSCLAQSNISMPDSDVVESLLEEHQVPAVGVGIIESGKVSAIKVFGQLKKEVPAHEEAIFDVASLTKSITTILTLRLVHQGKWDLDEPLYHYWIDPDVADHPYHKKITTRHVLSHRTGFKNWRWMNEDKKLSFDFEPGTQQQYSGEGFEYLRKAMEQKFQTSFEDLCASLVFKPDHMKSSQLVWSDNIDLKNFALWHKTTNEPYEDLESYQVNAADNLLTTVGDFANFGLNVMNKKGISEELYTEMIRSTDQVKDSIGMGLSWLIFEGLPNGEYALMNMGGDPGVKTAIVLLPNSKRGLVIFTNGDDGHFVLMKMIVQMLDVGGELVGRI